jgi:hypothetical protein
MTMAFFWFWDRKWEVSVYPHAITHCAHIRFLLRIVYSYSNNMRFPIFTCPFRPPASVFIAPSAIVAAACAS